MREATARHRASMTAVQRLPALRTRSSCVAALVWKRLLLHRPRIGQPSLGGHTYADQGNINDGLHTMASERTERSLWLTAAQVTGTGEEKSRQTNPTERPRACFPGGDALRRCYDGVGTRLS
jgi:hypothetical protein